MEPAGPARVERWLAAILAADVAGYSRLIEADEEGTLGRLKALRAELIDPKIAEHKGRIVKTTGDGLLVEFASVVDSLRCAVEMQAALAESNAPLPPERRVAFRIGIHQGDIVIEDGDIFGDGVNIAARLAGLAEPGGICVSSRVREDAAGRLDLASSVTRPGRAGETLFDAEPGAIAVPVLVISNQSDTCAVSPPGDAPNVLAAVTHSPRKELVIVTSSQIAKRSDPCEGMSPHGYLGIESTVVQRISDWIRAAGGRLTWKTKYGTVGPHRCLSG
jgi:class 3 adenylate cyclase